MKRVIVVLMILFSASLFAQTTGTIKRDNNYNPVNGYYDDVNDEVKTVTPDTPLPTRDNLSTGYYGATLITGTSTTVGDFFAFQVLADCVIDSLVSTKLTGNPNGLSLNAGTVLFLDEITRIKLQSGSVWAYKSE